MSIVVLQRDLTGLEAGDIAITAAEGGIGYWATIDEYKWTRWDEVDVPDDFVFYTIVEVDGGWDEVLHPQGIPVTPTLIAHGISLFLGGVPGNFGARPLADMEEFAAMDSDEADCVIQLGAFGSLIYG